MVEFTDKKINVSEFNEAAYQIARLNNLWTLCNTHSRKGNLIEYKWLLDRIWIELSADAKETDKKYYYDGIKVINNAIAKANNKDVLYNLLQRKEIFLKELQENVGKGGKKSKHFEDW